MVIVLAASTVLRHTQNAVERNPSNVTSAANVLVKQELSQIIKEHTLVRSLLNVTNAGNISVKQELFRITNEHTVMRSLLNVISAGNVVV